MDDERPFFFADVEGEEVGSDEAVFASIQDTSIAMRRLTPQRDNVVNFGPSL